MEPDRGPLHGGRRRCETRWQREARAGDNSGRIRMTGVVSVLTEMVAKLLTASAYVTVRGSQMETVQFRGSCRAAGAASYTPCRRFLAWPQQPFADCAKMMLAGPATSAIAPRR